MKGIALLVGILASCIPAHAGAFDFSTFRSIRTGSWAQAVAVGDVNGDRLDDVVVGTTFYFDEANDFRVFVYRQRLNGSLAAPIKFEYGQSMGSIALSLADLNEDGVSDVVAGQEGGLFLLLSDGAGGFVQRSYAPGSHVSPTTDCGSIAVMDVNLDGHLDIVGQSWSDGATIFYGNGRGDFPTMAFMPTGAKGYNDLKVGDVTGDGLPDLVLVSRQSTQFFVYPHVRTGLGQGVAYPTPNEGWIPGSVAIGDFNDDGINEVVMASPANRPESKLYIYSQDGRGALKAAPREIATMDIPEALVAHDLDLDGRQDLLVGHVGWGILGRYMQQPDGGLSDTELVVAAPFNEGPKALAVGDINDDGCPDAATAEHSYGLATLLGLGCNRNRPRVAADFDGDGASDIFWRNPKTGSNVIWRSADYARSLPMAAVPGGAWTVAGTGDFDGDGKADVLWHNRLTGASVIWRSGSYDHPRAVATVTNPAWKISGIADFDGDGKEDIFWRDTSRGGNAIWRSADYRLQMPVTAVTDLAWQVVATGDFDGDGRADLLWRNATTGKNAIWRAANSRFQQFISGVPDLDWQVVGGGDFDGDGESDVLWRRIDGVNVIWKSADATKRERLSTTPPYWVAAAIGDYDGNGKDDILWRDGSNGQNVVWRAAVSQVPRLVMGVGNLDWAIEQ